MLYLKKQTHQCPFPDIVTRNNLNQVPQKPFLYILNCQITRTFKKSKFQLTQVHKAFKVQK